MVEAWEQLRPTQPPMLDAKAAEKVQYLFAHRGRLLGMAFLNATLIPLLCRKAGVPEADARGKLTSHRALHDRQHARQRQGADDTAGAPAVAWPPLAILYTTLLSDPADEAGPTMSMA